MSKLQKLIKRFPWFTSTTGLALTFGLLVPTIFELGEKARSRHTGLERGALLVIVLTIAIAALIWFLNKPSDDSDDQPDKVANLQFGIRHILITMTVIAIAIGVAPALNPEKDILIWGMFGILVGTIGWTSIQRADLRVRSGTLIAGMFLPFVWIIAYNKPFGHTSGMLPGILFGPGLVPAMMLRRGNVDNTLWVAIIVVVLELGIGIWLAHRGRKLFAAYVVFCLLLSSVTSFFFHAMYRM